MPVDTTHPAYDLHRDDWRTIRDALEGSTTIRSAGERYLPKPLGMTPTDYENYLRRPEWYNATTRTALGLRGAVFRKEPIAQGVEAFAPWLSDVTGTGISLAGFLRLLFFETLAIGRYGVLLDMEREGAQRPCWCGFAAERIVNWKTAWRDGQERLTLVVLHEVRSVDDPTDIYLHEGIDHFRVLRLLDGVYTVEIWERPRDPQPQTAAETGLQRIDVVQPRRRGELLDFIPFLFFGPTSMESQIGRSPLWDLIRLNLRHWRHSADYEHGLHLTGLPTLVITGHNPQVDAKTFDTEGQQSQHTPTEIVLGSQGGILLPEADAKVYMLEFQGDGLNAARQALEDDKREMATLGARLLEERPDVQETATAVRLRQTGDESILRTLTQVLSEGITHLLRMQSWWLGLSGTLDDEKVSLALNQDFMSLRLTPQELVGLMQLWQGTAISKETLYYNFVQGEIAEPGIDFAQEEARIMANAPLSMPFGESEDEDQT
jgi:hypothetical protein